MANADRNNVIKRSSLNRPLSFQEGDKNLDELINVIDDQQNFETEQDTTNTALRNDVDSVEADVNGTGGVTDRVDVLENDLPKSAYGIIDVSVAGSNVTIGTNDAKANGLRLVGTLTANVSVIVPNDKREWTIVNETTGDFTVTIKTELGNGVVVPQGQTFVVRCDGTDVVRGVDSQRTIYVGSVAELEALSLAAGTAVYLTEEGRAGDLVVKTGTPPGDPQKGIYIVLANGNYAERIYSGPINVLWFGADKTGATDSSESIQGALDLSNRVYIPAGDYIASVVAGKRDSFIFGDSFSTTITPTAGSPYCIGINGKHITVSELRISLPAGFTGYGIKTAVLNGTNSIYTVLEHVSIQASADAEACIYISTENGWTGYNRLFNVYAIGGKRALLCDSSNVLTIIGGAYSGASVWGIDSTSSNTYISGIANESNGDSAVALDYRGATAGGIRLIGQRNDINNVWSEGNVGKWKTGVNPASNFYIEGSCTVSNLRGDREGSYAGWCMVEDYLASNPYFSYSIESQKILPASGKNMLTNPLLKNDGAGAPLGDWVKAVGTQTVEESTTIYPAGFKRSAKLTNLDSNNFLTHPIDDIIATQNKVSLSFWLYYDRAEGPNTSWLDTDTTIYIGIADGPGAGALAISRSIRLGPGTREQNQQWVFFQSDIDVSTISAGNVIITNTNDSVFYIAGIAVSPAGSSGVLFV